MSKIKDIIEDLAINWSYAALKVHPSRKEIFNQRYVGVSTKVALQGKYNQEFTLRYDQNFGDVRIWTKAPAGLIQWRSCGAKGDRLIYKSFVKGTFTERLPLEDIFMDPRNVDEGEVAMFEVLYADMAPILPLFAEALSQLDVELHKRINR